MGQLQADIAADYERIRERVSEDPGTAGDDGEETWAGLLREWLPPTYTVVTKGRVIAPDGKASPQMDVLVLKGVYPKKLLNRKTYLSAGVAAAFECKLTLRSAHIKEAVEKETKLKSLYEPRKGDIYKELHSPIVYGLLAHSHEWKSEKSEPKLNIERALEQSHKELVKHPRLNLDIICVADLTTWVDFKRVWPSLSLWNPEVLQRSDDPHLEAVKFIADNRLTSVGHNDIKTFGEPYPTTAVGSFVASLIRRLALENADMRDMAKYFSKVLLNGRSYSPSYTRYWPVSIYSDEVSRSVRAGTNLSSDEWSGWNWWHH